MSASERVLGPNGFEPFPKRIEEKQIEQGHKQRPADAGDPTASDLPDHGTSGEKDLLKEQAEQKAAQAEADKTPPRDLTEELKEAQEAGAEPADPAAHDLPAHGLKGRAELSKKQQEQARAQAEADAKSK